jgi:thiol-disulfide isomerase/thioredoxin
VAAGLVVLGVALVLATATGFVLRRRNGRVRESTGPRLTEDDLGQPLGERATLLQFSSAFCAPCRATRQLLTDVADRSPGVAHVEFDVTSRMDLARRLDIRRTPTVLVLGPQGQVARRASGLPDRAQVIDALALATGERALTRLPTCDPGLTGGMSPHSIGCMPNAIHTGRRDASGSRAWRALVPLTRRRPVDYCHVATALCPWPPRQHQRG